MTLFRNLLSGAAIVSALSLGLGAAPSLAQNAPPVYGTVNWGVWVDHDGCMHWWADGGLEGYMIDRVDPKTGKPVCLAKNTCLVENTDTLFATDSARLTRSGRARLQHFFSAANAFGYAIYGHTDSRASDGYNIRLSKRRAAAVAKVARSVGAVVEREIGFGERQPLVPNTSAANMQKNRRVEVVCYTWDDK
ncbi:OmpA family protein [Aliiroseovarius sp. KMU-50]|uniref:OmpA family protein n=1 Tax=Aliiroseovarius salicola TaxID=3009082 RepID=A0ABT4W4W4_9RHOB|nr:OmpA family protein [Aliiroseovarius sp. KMU-50]MDA5095510.1 OmpA family protein [Aliiroseovarius sp. KMU-50]